MEDTQLVLLIEKYDPPKWTLIAQTLPGRDGKHCRERWHNHLNPRNKKSEWTKIEEWVLFLMYQSMGSKWASIAQVLVGRTDNSIKNHWNSSMRKKVKSMQKSLDAYIDQILKFNKIDS